MSQERTASSAHHLDQPAESGNLDTAQAGQDATTATTAEHYERATAALEALVDEYSRTRAELADSGAQ